MAPRSQMKIYKLFTFLSLMLTFVPIFVLYPEINDIFRNVVYMIQEQYEDELRKNKTFLLTINHDTGRLGNKMFKYASLLGIAKRERRKPFVLPYKIDLDMESLFNLTHVAHRTKIAPYWWSKIEETQYAYNDPIFMNLPPKNLKLLGYMQSWKYFVNVETELREEFSLTPTMKQEAYTILNDIQQKWSGNKATIFIGVHVRRLDEWATQKTTVGPISFYLKSFKKMRALLPGQHLIFVISGNNLDWCEQNMAGDNVTVLKPASPSIHFAVLASCQHFIISTGTFGWWAGWLTGGHVIFYKKFPLPGSHEAKGFHYKDYYPPSWIPVGD